MKSEGFVILHGFTLELFNFMDKNVRLSFKEGWF